MSEAGGRSELDQQARIHPTVVKKLLQLHWNKDPAADGAKINPDAAVLTAEYLRLFVIGRAATHRKGYAGHDAGLLTGTGRGLWVHNGSVVGRWASWFLRCAPATRCYWRQLPVGAHAKAP